MQWAYETISILLAWMEGDGRDQHFVLSMRRLRAWLFHHRAFKGLSRIVDVEALPNEDEGPLTRQLLEQLYVRDLKVVEACHAGIKWPSKDRDRGKTDTVFCRFEPQSREEEIDQQFLRDTVALLTGQEYDEVTTVWPSTMDPRSRVEKISRKRLLLTKPWPIPAYNVPDFEELHAMFRDVPLVYRKGELKEASESGNRWKAEFAILDHLTMLEMARFWNIGEPDWSPELQDEETGKLVSKAIVEICNALKEPFGKDPIYGTESTLEAPKGETHLENYLKSVNAAEGQLYGCHEVLPVEAMCLEYPYRNRELRLSAPNVECNDLELINKARDARKNVDDIVKSAVDAEKKAVKAEQKAKEAKEEAARDRVKAGKAAATAKTNRKMLTQFQSRQDPRRDHTQNCLFSGIRWICWKLSCVFSYRKIKTDKDADEKEKNARSSEETALKEEGKAIKARSTAAQHAAKLIAEKGAKCGLAALRVCLDADRKLDKLDDALKEVQAIRKPSKSVTNAEQVITSIKTILDNHDDLKKFVQSVHELGCSLNERYERHERYERRSKSVPEGEDKQPDIDRYLPVNSVTEHYTKLKEALKKWRIVQDHIGEDAAAKTYFLRAEQNLKRLESVVKLNMTVLICRHYGIYLAAATHWLDTRFQFRQGRNLHAAPSIPAMLLVRRNLILVETQPQEAVTPASDRHNEETPNSRGDLPHVVVTTTL